MTTEYIIVKDNGFNPPLSYFCADSFWSSRDLATSFSSQELAEHHCYKAHPVVPG
jgi:hypothetical protein